MGSPGISRGQRRPGIHRECATGGRWSRLPAGTKEESVGTTGYQQQAAMVQQLRDREQAAAAAAV